MGDEVTHAAQACMPACLPSMPDLKTVLPFASPVCLQHIKQRVLDEGALQPVISLLSSPCPESQREGALLLGQFATTTPGEAQGGRDGQ